MDAHVVFAVYGALRGGERYQSEAADVTSALQRRLDRSVDGKIRIDNTSMDQDPAKGVQKHFAAIVEIGGREHPFACLERQTIDFSEP